MVDTFPNRRTDQLIEMLRPAVHTWSMIAALLGGCFVLLTLFVVWMGTPQAISLLPFTDHLTLVTGGQDIGDMAPNIRAEFASAMAFLVVGVMGVLTSRDRATEE